MRCLDENTAIAFSGGELDENELAAIDVHVDRCPDCLAFLAAIARSVSVAPAVDVTETDGVDGSPTDVLRRGARIGRYARRRLETEIDSRPRSSALRHGPRRSRGDRRASS